MKHILFILLVGGIVGCGDGVSQEDRRSAPSQYYTIVIDGCEYLAAGAVPNTWHVITHKGNCNNHGVPTLQDVLDESNTLTPTDSLYWIEKYKGHTKIKVVWDSLTKRWEEVMIFENGEYPLNTKNK